MELRARDYALRFDRQRVFDDLMERLTVGELSVA